LAQQHHTQRTRQAVCTKIEKYKQVTLKAPETRLETTGKLPSLASTDPTSPKVTFRTHTQTSVKVVTLMIVFLYRDQKGLSKTLAFALANQR